ncbi:DUF4168 domain-containing protein [Croceibacterium ferulae]|uniref:DUF4168 domain-containing protein n=1 Tax=Croceibacterium ferulae TaxID=1854641 RepID=UPI000EABD695|nr:DUF4168 domain-containing protein [Croceibacterium ferulae]
MKLLFAAIAASALVSASAFGLPPRSAQAVQSGSISDDEVGRFALIALVINQVESDATMTSQQKKAAVSQAMQRNGMAADRFSQIVNASRTDASLQQRIRAAADAQIEAVRARQRGRR